MIRKITNNDLKEIYYLGNKYDKSFDKKFNLEDYINNPIYHLYCFEDEEIIKGFIIATQIFECVEILLVYVDEIYRKQGIAIKLMSQLEKSDVANLLLEVSIENESAYNLYKKLDYNIISTRKKYYNGVDAYVMKKVLK